MSVTIYFEDGRLKDEVHERPDAPPIIYLKAAKLPQRIYVGHVGVDDPPGPEFMDIETIAYHREFAPHRFGVICYWQDEQARDRAAVEDTYVSEGPAEAVAM